MSITLNKKLTFGLVGLGPMGKNYLKTIQNLHHAEIKYICSKTSQTLTEFSSDYIKFTDYKKLGEYKLDGVIIATPASTHFEIAKFFLKKKIPLLIEKPVTINYEQALKLFNIQKESNTPVLVGHTILYYPAYIKLKKLVSKIGQIQEIEFIGKNNSPRKDTSVLYDWGSHALAVFMDILSDIPIHIKIINTSKNNQELFDEIKAYLFFDSNIKAFLDISWKSPSKQRLIKVTGTKGSVSLDTVSMQLTFNKKTATFDKTQPLGKELEEFIGAIQKSKPIHSNLEFSTKVMQALSQIDEKLAKA